MEFYFLLKEKQLIKANHFRLSFLNGFCFSLPIKASYWQVDHDLKTQIEHYQSGKIACLPILHDFK
jgi:hypothetical protein